MANDTPIRDGVRERFLADHREIEQLLERVLAICEDGDREDVAAVWTEFDARLLAHMGAEERYLIPLLQRANPRAARAIQEEHRHFRTRLTELGSRVDLHAIRLHEVRALVGELRAHSAHEDRTLYTLADLELDPGDRERLFDALRNRESRGTSRRPVRTPA
jgi:hypothetical protein